jgi:hypothetical protein
MRRCPSVAGRNASVRAPPPLLLRSALIQLLAATWHHASPHCQSQKPTPSRCAPSSRHCHTFSVSHSIALSAPPSCCYPLRHCCLSVQATVAHHVLLPTLHAGSTTPTLEAKPHHQSPVARPPELHHYRPSSSEPRATAAMVPQMSTACPYPVYSPRVDRCRERCQGHPRRWFSTCKGSGLVVYRR